MITPDTFIPNLAQTKSLNEHYAFVNSCIQRNEIRILEDLFVELFEFFSFNSQEWAPRGASERIVHALALTNSLEHAHASVKLTLKASVWRPGLLALTRLASMIASCQSVPVVSV